MQFKFNYFDFFEEDLYQEEDQLPYINLHVMRMCHVPNLRTPKVDITNKVKINLYNIKKFYKDKRFNNTEEGKASCIQYNWVVHTLKEVLLANPEKELYVTNWAVRSGSVRAFTFCDVLFRDISFVCYKKMEYRLFGRGASPMKWKSGKLILKGLSSIEKILQTYNRERKENEGRRMAEIVELTAEMTTSDQVGAADGKEKDLSDDKDTPADDLSDEVDALEGRIDLLRRSLLNSNRGTEDISQIQQLGTTVTA